MTPDDQKSIDNLLALIAMDAADMTAEQLKAAREAAGLSTNQAARLIGPLCVSIIDIECPGRLGELKRGAPNIMRAIFDRMNEAYGLKGAKRE